MTVPTPARPPTVLLVDDHDDGRASLAMVLSAHGFNVWQAATAADAFRLARNRPDLVVLDVVLPDANGIDVCRRLKADPATAAPVLLLSGFAVGPADRVRGLEHGADAYLTKPADPNVLTAQLRSLWRNRQAELAHARLAAIVESSNAAIIGIDPNLIVESWNTAAEWLFGYTADEMIGRSLLAIVPEDLRVEARRVVTRVVAGDHVPDYEAVRYRKDGRPVHVSVRLWPVRDSTGACVGLAVIYSDLTGRRTADQAAAVLDSATEGVCAFDREWRFTYLNPQAERLLRGSQKNLLGRVVWDAFPGAVGTTTYHEYHRAQANGVPVEFEDHCPPFKRWFRIRAVPSPEGLLAHFTDVTDRRRAEDLLRTVIAHIPCGVFWKDRDSVYLGCNDRVAWDFGLTSAAEVVGKTDFDLSRVRSEAEHFRAFDRWVIETGQVLLSIEEPHTRPDGSRAVLLASKVPLRDATGDVVGVLGIYEDVTERRRLEEQYRQAQKMEAVGRLAGGIAHDFNNLLTIINGYSELLLEALKPEEPARAFAAEMARAGERAAGLTRQLLAFSRLQVLQPRLLDLNAVVADLARLLGRLLGEDVELATALAPGLWPVQADPGQVEQVLMNLCVNARDAMPTGGKLTIETSNVELDAGYTQGHPEARPGRYVLLAVSDTGVGMTEEVRSRVFEPFFTTKEVGKGTGLGLATAHGIVKQSGGHIDVYSEPGVGTTFKVYLPRAEAGSGPKSGGSSERSAPRGTETVLVAEDEDAVRALTGHILRSAGYTVLEAADGAEAVRLAESHPGPLDLLVTDVVMPRMSGRLLVEQLLDIRPGVRVLFLSGYTDDAVVRHGVLEDRVQFLQKPFTPAALAWKVREVLDAPRNGA